jgi:hypothetical protein
MNHHFFSLTLPAVRLFLRGEEGEKAVVVVVDGEKNVRKVCKQKGVGGAIF